MCISWLCHLSALNGRPLEWVVTSDMLGIAGDNGRSNGIHLHLAVQHFGQGLTGHGVDWVVDPEKFLGV